MTRSNAMRILLAGSLLAASGACSEQITLAPEPGPPASTTPQTSARVFEWAVNTSHPGQLEGIFAADFELLSAEVDSAGNAAGARLSRDEVIAGFRSMLEGVPGRYEPASARLQLDRNLMAFPVSRPGADPRGLRTLRTWFVMQVNDVAAGQQFEVSGALRFHVVRGDFADIPPGSAQGADSLHWWIDGIEEETASIAAVTAGRTSAIPSKQLTLRQLLDLYRLRLGP